MTTPASQSSAWAVDRGRQVVSRAGVEIHFQREGPAWVADCRNPNCLNALLGDGEGREERLSLFMREAARVWHQTIVSRHTRKRCPHRRDPHPWSKCPGNQENYPPATTVK